MDIYEPAQMRRALGKLGIEVKVSSLNIGDYLISDSVCIERKTVSDFLSSMYSGRLGYQLQLLARSFSMPFLLIEGRPEYHPRTINMKSFYGYLARVLLSSHIGLLQTPDMRSSALLIYLIFQKSGQRPTMPERTRLRPPKTRTRRETVLRVLEAFPGIGPVLSGRLLREFKTLRSVFESPADLIGEVEGMGEQKAGEIVRVLDHEYGG
jgi:ERCC4-type nuclease